MLLETTKPVALALCMVALCSVFNEAFLAQSNNPAQTMWDMLTLFALAAGICVASGMLFRESEAEVGYLLRTLPMQIFLWAGGVMVALFLASWYLETYCIFYRDMRRL